MSPQSYRPDNAALLLIDHQVGSMASVDSIQFEEMRQNALLLAKVAKTLDVPLVLTSSMEDGYPGPLLAGLERIAPDEYADRIRRQGPVDPFDDARFVVAVADTCRANMIIAGGTHDVSTTFAVLTALDWGYRVQVVADAGGSSSRSANDIAIRRMERAGAVITSTSQLLAELIGDWTGAEAAKIMPILGQRAPTTTGATTPTGRSNSSTALFPSTATLASLLPGPASRWSTPMPAPSITPPTAPPERSLPAASHAAVQSGPLLRRGQTSRLVDVKSEPVHRSVTYRDPATPASDLPIARPVHTREDNRRSGEGSPTSSGLVGSELVSLSVRGPLTDRKVAGLRSRIEHLIAAGYRTIDVRFDPDVGDTSSTAAALRGMQHDAARSSVTVTISQGTGPRR